MITFRCSGCSVLVQTHDSKVGKPVTCRHCHHVTVCPPTSVLSPLRPAAAARPRAVGSRGFLATLGAIGLGCIALVIMLH